MTALERDAHERGIKDGRAQMLRAVRSLARQHAPSDEVRRWVLGAAEWIETELRSGGGG